MQGRERPAVRKLGGRSIRVPVALAPGRRKLQGTLEPQESEQEGPGAPGAASTVRWQVTETRCPSCFSWNMCSGPLSLEKVPGCTGGRKGVSGAEIR